MIYALWIIFLVVTSFVAIKHTCVVDKQENM